MSENSKNPLKVLIETFPILTLSANKELFYAISQILKEEKDKQEGLATGFATLQREILNLEDEKNRYKLQSERIANDEDNSNQRISNLVQEKELSNIDIIAYRKKIVELEEIINIKDVKIGKQKSRIATLNKAISDISKDRENKKDAMHKQGMKLPEEKELAEKLLTGFDYFGNLLGRINAKLDITVLDINNIIKPFEEYSRTIRRDL